MDLSVVILSFNTKRLLRDCLASIFNQTKGVNFEVIVVDNGSTDESVVMLEELRTKNKELRTIKNKRNLGFAKANNQGIKKAQAEYVLLLNSDTVLKNNAFLKLIEFAKDHPRAGIIGPRLLNKDGSEQPSTASFFTLFRVFFWLFTGDRFLFSSPAKATPVDWLMGAALLVKKEALEKAGPLDEKFFMYMEEVEWCYRFKQAGWQVWFCPEAEIYHLVRGSSADSWQGRQKAVWGIYQGLIYFYQRHFAPWQLSVLKFCLKVKAAGAWLIGVLTNNQYLKKTYAKAFKMACHV